MECCGNRFYPMITKSADSARALCGGKILHDKKIRDLEINADCVPLPMSSCLTCWTCCHSCDPHRQGPLKGSLPLPLRKGHQAKKPWLLSLLAASVCFFSLCEHSRLSVCVRVPLLSHSNAGRCVVRLARAASGGRQYRVADQHSLCSGGRNRQLGCV